MSETTVGGMTAVTPTTVPPAEVPKPAPDPAYANMRVQMEAEKQARVAAEQRLAELEAKAQELERSKLDETERLRLEVKELQPLRDTQGRYASAFERLYNEELEAIPEEKREQVKALSSVGDWDARVIAVRAAKALIPAPVAAQPMGSVTNPGNPGAAPGHAPEPQRPMTPEELKRFDLRRHMDSLRAKRA